MDIFKICLQEVALEGLDGVTLPTLWLRLVQREEKVPINLTESLKNVLWNFLSHNASIDCFQLEHGRPEPSIFDRFLGFDTSAGKHVATAPDELDTLDDIYPIKPISQPNIKGSCWEFESRKDVTKELKMIQIDLQEALLRYGAQKLVLVGSQKLRENVLRAPGITPQTVEELGSVDYCILERIGRSRWQGEIQTVLNNVIFKQLKASHIHYLMKSLHVKGLVVKQGYSYIRPDKAGKIHQQVLFHLPHYKKDARYMTDAKIEVMCELLSQSKNETMKIGDLKEIVGIDRFALKKLIRKMESFGYVKVTRVDNSKIMENRLMKLLKAPTPKQEVIEDQDEDENNNDCVTSEMEAECGVVAELPLSLQGYRYIIAVGENGCSQTDMLSLLKGYGSLEARHICRKMEKAKLVKIIMVDIGKQRTQKYIAKDYATSSSYTKQLLAEKKKRKEILKTSARSHANDTCNEGFDVQEATSITTPAESSTSSDTIRFTNLEEDASRVDDVMPPVASDLMTNKTDSVQVSNSTCSSENPAEHATEDAPNVAWHRNKWDGHETTRKMRRSNLILSFINEHKIVEGFVGMLKLLQNSESDEGIKSKVCKKTVKRIISKLANDGLLKSVNLPITAEERTINVDFIMSLDCGPARLKTAIETVQFRMFSEESRKIGERIDLTKDSPLSIHTALEIPDIIKQEDLKPIKQIQYGFQPKFVRLQMIHDYLWYLAYEHPHGKMEGLDYELVDYDKVKEYSKDQTWKRFLPPAPKHPEYGEGWLQVGDIAVILPLTILCQYHRFSYKVDGLQQYLDDPIRRNMLVRHMPLKLKVFLLHKRKYILSLVQVIETLAFMGLISLSQQKKRTNCCLHKENEMIYVHKNVSILDTRKSQKSYHKVTAGIEYEKFQFHLETSNDVDKYWMKLKDVCLMTPLGVKIGGAQDEEPSKKNYAKMQKFLSKHIGRERIEASDDGVIPGDQLGAGGLDSSLFSHLYRNWFRSVKIDKKQDGASAKSKTASSSGEINKNPVLRRLPKLIPTVDLTGKVGKKVKKKSSREKDKDILKSPENRSNDESKGRKRIHSTKSNCVNSKSRKLSSQSKVKENEDLIDLQDTQVEKKSSHIDSSTDEYEIVTENNIGRNKNVQGGRGKKRKTSPKPKPQAPKAKKKKIPKERPKSKRVMDSLDLKALKNMTTLRSSFSSAEDTLLLHCKIASTIIMKKVKLKGRKPTNCAVPGTVLRDFLHKNCKGSFDKTSHACTRRIRFIRRYRDIGLCHDITVAELVEDKAFNKRMFEEDVTEDVLNNPEKIERLFLRVVAEVQKRFYSSQESELILPDTLKELHQRFDVKVMVTMPKVPEPKFLQEIENADDITFCVLENLMYAALSLNEDEFSQYQAYKIFETYQEQMIAKVWDKVKVSGNICKKADQHLARQRHLPFAVPTFHLSVSYYAHFKSKCMDKVFMELLECVSAFERKHLLSCDFHATSGPITIINTLLLNDQDNISIRFPDNDVDTTPDDKGNAAAVRFPWQKNENVRISASKTVNDGEKLSFDDLTLSDCEDLPENSKLSQKQLYKLYRQSRLARWPGGKGISSFPIGIVDIRMSSNHLQQLSNELSHESGRDSSLCTLWNMASNEEMEKAVTSLHSQKLSTQTEVISLDEDELLDELKDIVCHQPNCKDGIQHIINVAETAGVIGKPLHEIVTFSEEFSSQYMKQCLDVLVDRRLIYILGMHEQRAVLRQYAHKWFVVGALYKGDRRILREQIRNELMGTTKRHDSTHLKPRVYRKRHDDKQQIDVSDGNPIVSHELSENLLGKNETNGSEDVKKIKEISSPLEKTKNLRSKSSPDETVACLFDSSSYEKVTFLCRPWHSISGDVNYTNAKMFLTGVFLHILWNPGITLKLLDNRFKAQLHKVALLELLEKLLLYKCIVCRKMTRSTPNGWNLFQPLSSPDLHQECPVAKDSDYYIATSNSVLRMTQLCKSFDELARNREKTFDDSHHHSNGGKA
ncbi:general transcription factor 3C polypeptide 1-like isoform X1 [Clavelina lepadiformis]|uniref:general transcription factor 3C polypeptide 1-like isoform X1 n=1 Tax=Clavelina lepadiformis TaxID=159417 RepID=UPI004041C2DA